MRSRGTIATQEPIDMDDTLAYQTITGLAAMIRAGKATPVELAEAMLARIEALDPHLHAFIALTRRRALAEARAAQSALDGGHDLGPLHGVPYAVKDLYDVAGEATTGGTRWLAGNVARA